MKLANIGGVMAIMVAEDIKCDYPWGIQIPPKNEPAQEITRPRFV